jgi:hypothetical protein
MATGEGAAFLGAAGAVLIAVGIARVSLGQTQKSLPGWQAFSFLTLYLQYSRWGYKTCQISSGFLACKWRVMWGHYFGEEARGLTVLKVFAIRAYLVESRASRGKHPEVIMARNFGRGSGAW